MNVDTLIKKAIELSQIKTIRFFFRIIEAILFWYYSKTFKKKIFLKLSITYYHKLVFVAVIDQIRRAGLPFKALVGFENSICSEKSAHILYKLEVSFL